MIWFLIGIALGFLFAIGLCLAWAMKNLRLWG